MEKSFCDLIRTVVYANGRPGATQITRNRFVITIAKTGMRLQEQSWADAMRSGLHIEQAIVVSGVKTMKDKCLYPGCSGTVSEQPGRHGKIWLVRNKFTDTDRFN